VYANLYAVTPASEEPVSVADAKAQCRVDSEDEDLYLRDNLIVAARQWAETLTGRAFVQQTWELKLPAFPECEIELPKPPLISVTSVKYLDTAGVEQTWAPTNYIVTAPTGETAQRGRITPAYGVIFPSTHPVPDAVRIVFVAGYGAVSAVPRGIKNAILFHVAQAYQNREQPDFALAANAIWPWVETRFD
jgi:uncharacterized phiE125 gp8 family phage protein